MKSNKKIIIICIICTLVGAALIGGMGILIYRELNQNEQKKGTTASVDAQAADQLEDGEVYDFEKAGFIQLGEYIGLEADVQPEDEDVYYELIALADETKKKEKGDDGAVDGDVVNVDFEGKLDGKELEDASGEDAYLRLGNDEYIEDFEKGIIGMKRGEKKTVDCTFPEDYDDEELAGKTVQFAITLNEIFNDTIAKKSSDGKYNTVQEYIEYERASQLEENQASKGELVWDTLKEDTDVESAPEQMLERTQEDITKMYESFAELSGMTVEDLLADFNMDEDGLSEIATDTVIDVMIAKTIAVKENITMDDAYYEQALREMLGIEETDDEPMTLEELEKEYKASQGSRPRDDMLVERVKDFVGEKAVESK